MWPERYAFPAKCVTAFVDAVDLTAAGDSLVVLVTLTVLAIGAFYRSIRS
ncbi:hypothetical protein [Halegenticoccus tardaugens]|nr:hypothetical protein [Halegenticoccus tardaugens]